jgi:hypothetical protein
MKQNLITGSDDVIFAKVSRPLCLPKMIVLSRRTIGKTGFRPGEQARIQ